MNEKDVSYEVITQECDDGDVIIPLPEPLLKQLGWKEGDTINVTVGEDGKLYLSK